MYDLRFTVPASPSRSPTCASAKASATRGRRSKAGRQGDVRLRPSTFYVIKRTSYIVNFSMSAGTPLNLYIQPSTYLISEWTVFFYVRCKHVRCATCSRAT
jgi:hypothetical protein